MDQQVELEFLGSQLKLVWLCREELMVWRRTACVCVLCQEQQDDLQGLDDTNCLNLLLQEIYNPTCLYL